MYNYWVWVQSRRSKSWKSLCLPTVVGVSGGAVQIKTVKVGSAQIQMSMSWMLNVIGETECISLGLIQGAIFVE